MYVVLVVLVVVVCVERTDWVCGLII